MKDSLRRTLWISRVTFLEAVRRIKAELPHARTSGGISNVSFAFRGNDAVREAMHAAFLYHGIRAGLDIKESLVVRNNRFRSMLCTDLTCCPPEGTQIPDLDTSRIAAEHVIAGHPMPYDSVEGLIQSIAALPSSFGHLSFLR